jgi:hypothetical protein
MRPRWTAAAGLSIFALWGSSVGQQREAAMPNETLPAMRRWIAIFSIASVGAVAAVLFLLWAMSGFGDIGVTGNALVALIIGVIFSTGLGVALMALVFYSARSEVDEDVYQANLPLEPNPDGSTPDKEPPPREQHRA